MKFLPFILLLSFMVNTQAAIDVYQFDNTEKTARFKQLVADLRCPKCQNQNLADSNAEIARDLRSKVEQMLVADKSDDEIVQYMVDRYGDFVLYEPRVTTQTYILWYGPIALFLVAFAVIFFIVRIRSQQPREKVNSTLNKQQKQQLDQLLDK